jgi:hypothetical protein
MDDADGREGYACCRAALDKPLPRSNWPEIEDTVEKLIAYQLYPDISAPIRPAVREKPWMEATDGKFAYRCLPLAIANQYGWELLATHHLRVTWDGDPRQDGMHIKVLGGEGEPHCGSHFGNGVFTFNIPYLFQTPPNWNLMIRGPMNSPKDGIIALDAIIETDWAHATFTMNWRFTRPCTVEFAIGEPICLFFPIQRGLMETFEGEIRMLDSNSDLSAKYQAWGNGREESISNQQEGAAEAHTKAWPKGYTHSAVDKKLRLCPFKPGGDV